MTPLISRSLMSPQPQEIGKIKLGGRGKAHRTSGGVDSYLPERFDHFEVTTMERDGKNGPFKRDEAVHEKVGAEPKELRGIIMYPEVEQNLMTSMRVYKGRKPSVKCDGDTQVNAQGKREPCTRLAGGTCECRPYCRLQLQLLASPHTGGYYVFRTRSWQTTNNLQTFLEETYARFGTLFQAPVKLMMYQSEDQYEVDGKEKVGRAYLYGTPHKWVALNAEYLYERFERDERTSNTKDLKTHRVPLGVVFSHPSGLNAMFRATYFDQKGEFLPQGADPLPENLVSGEDQFWLCDASIGYRLPNRYGMITVGAKNLFDTSFQYFDTNYLNPTIQPDRMFFARITLSI